MRKVYLTMLFSIFYFASVTVMGNEVRMINSDMPTEGVEEFVEMEEDLVTCGSISAVRIYDQYTDQPVSGIAPLYDGMSIDGSLLPSNYYIVVETQGTIESVNIWINGNMISTENVAPYTYPGGAENGNSWNGGSGSFTLDAQAFLFDNGNHECSSVSGTFHIVGGSTGGCDDVTNPGSIEGGFTACSDSEYTITSNALPSGGSGDLEYVWLFNPNSGNLSGSSAIPNSNVEELTTNNNQSGWYRRCSQRVGCSGFINGESNWVHVSVEACPCDDVTEAGSIQGGFTACANEDFTIINTELPSGGSGELEFVWLFNPNEGSLIGYEAIPNSNVAELTISNDQSGWYRRCAQREGCSGFANGESNWVHVSIDGDCNDLTPPSTLDCENGFLWENNVDINTLNGGAGIPAADLRFVDFSVTQYTIPGPYPSEFDGEVIISSIEAISWDGYLNRPNTGDQPNEQWRVIFRNNGSTVYSSDYTEDLSTGTLVAETTTTLGSNITLAGIDEIILAHYEDDDYGSGSSSSANSVVPVSICINFAAGCENTPPTADNLDPEINVECDEDFPTITFSDETSSATVTNYEEYPASASCEIDFSTYPAYSNKNIWFHAFNDNYNKHFQWNDGNVITLPDNTVKLIGRIQNVDDANSGFFIEFYFEELQDQATFVAAGGYNSTDSDAADRLYANVDFTKPNSIVGFGAFADADLELTSAGNVHHMDIGPRNVYGGYGFGFWIDYVGTVNGEPVGNSATSGTNHLDMYSALNTCYENEDCGDFIIREWTVEDECGNADIFIQHVNVVDTEAPVANGVEDAVVSCDEALPTNEPTFTDCDEDLEITFEETSDVNADGLTVITRAWTATDDCGNSTTSSYTITITACTNVGDTVWYDNDRDGIQDDDEGGVEGVTVNLISSGADGEFHTADDVVVDSQETDGNGNYLFEEVLPGEYCIEFIEATIPADYIFTDQDQGGNDAEDSDVDALGKTESFTVTSGQDDDLTWDAGIYTCTEITVPGGDVADLTFECSDDIPAPVEPDFTDPVDSDLEIVYSESQETEDCQSYITRVWTATNDCGATLTVDQLITIVDTTAPTLEGVPENATYACLEDVPSAADVVANDNCDDNPEVLYSESSDGPDCENTITRIWTVIDDCDNTTEYTQMILITDEESPEVASSPSDANLECGDDMPNDEPTFTDNCDDDLTIEMSEEESGDGCSKTITRTWTATDDCGNEVSTSQTITFNDSTAPTASNVPVDASLECSDDLPTGEPTFVDICDEDLTIEFSEESNALACQYELIRTWTATDDCGNAFSVSQTITVTDGTAPTLEGVPANATYACLEDVPSAADVVANDNCDDNPEVLYSESSDGENCESTITRIWTVIDDCDNTTEYTQLIMITDDESPEVVSTPEEATIQCGEDMPNEEPTFTDNCDDDLTIEMSEEESGDGCPKIITRTWTATDDCGNEVSTSQTITINDNTAPTASNLPEDVTVECSEALPTDEPTFTDICDEDLTIDFSEENNALDCQYELVRTWTATDDCGNTFSVSQTITVTDATAPTLDGIPSNETVACLDEVNDAPEVTAADNCDDNPVVEFGESSEENGCETLITRTWTVTDACDNVTEYTQLITVNDNVAPEVVDAPENVTIECADDMPADEPSFSDNCDDDLTVNFEETESGTTCPLVITRTWTATDDCGNEVSVSQEITINDTTAPEVANAPEDMMVQCDEAIPSAEPTFTDNCDEDLTIDFSEENNALSCQYELVRTWTATDDCGNSTSVSQTITITDATAPTLDGVPMNANVECLNDVPAVPEVTANDNCDENPVVEFSETSEEDGCETLITRNWTVTDDCDNVTSYMQLISVSDETAPTVESELDDASILCDEELPAGEPTFADNCDADLTIEYAESTSYDAEGNMVYTRTWTATDDCGNAASSTQLVTMAPCTNVGDTVWYDVDQDGIQDADEDGVPGVTVNLVSAGPDGLYHTADDVIADSQVTDENGNYLFEQVFAGEYCIEFVASTIPADYIFTGTDEGVNDATDSDSDEDGKTEPFTVEAGQADDLTFDAGIYNPVNIGDAVWYDFDQDGVQDADEEGVEGVTVNLISAGPDGEFHTADDVVADSQETDENGNYLFEEVAPGDYCIEFVASTIPADYIFTGTNEGGDDALDSDADGEGKTEAFEVVDGQDDDLTFDAGIYSPVNIGDTVFNDLDQDGVQDAGEPGVEGVTVNLISAGPDGLFHTDDDVLAATEVTDENGNYLFEEVAPGDYCIEFVESTLPTGTQFTASNVGNDVDDSDADAEGKTEPFEVVAGQEDNLTYDAGIIDPVNIGDTVWYDVDQDGTQDADEDGVAGVTVNLISAGPDGLFHTADDFVIDSEETDENGNYLFEGVAPGDYCIEFVASTIPADYIFTGTDQGDDAADSDADAEGKTEPFSVDPGQDDDLTFDAGIYSPVNVGDLVFNDLDQDGIQDAGEPGVEGVTVNLISAGPDGLFHTDDDFVVDSEETDENGNYLFEDVAPGDYCIEFVGSTLPSGTEFTAANAGDDAEDSDADAEGKTEAFTITEGQDDDLTFDAGIIDPVNVGDFVFNDLNQDGIQDADEPGVEGVTVNLISAGPDGLFHTDDDFVVDSQETDENGNYLFEGVAPGEYCIEFVAGTLPVGSTFTDSNQGGDDEADSDVDAEGKTESFTIEAGQDDNLSFDAGIMDPISIGDTVFNDLDRDGIQDADEPGVEGVTVNLISAGPDGLFHTDDDIVVDSQETDENGNYLFDEVAPGEYCIEFVASTIPTGFDFTMTDQGGDDALDSDADEDGKTGAFTIVPNQADDLTFDAGIYTCTDITVEEPLLEDLELECTDNLPIPVEPNFVDPIDSNLDIEFEESSIMEGCNEVITRTWTATNDCGATATFTQTITISDSTAPEYANAPEDVTVECSDDLPNDEPTFTDNCDDQLTVDFSEEVNTLDCQEEIVRTWTATDDCGNEVSVSQTITITDTTAPGLDGVPGDLTVECASDVPAAAEPIGTDNCDNSLAIDFNESSESNGCVLTITRTWVVTDNCDNSSTHLQVITVEDTTAPVASNEPADMTLSCTEGMPTDAPDFTDNCDQDLTIEFVEENAGAGCENGITRTWTATDDCGNSTVVTQIIMVMDDVAPELNVPADIAVDCSTANTDPSTTGNGTATDNCSGASVTYSDSPVQGSCPITIIRTWSAVDGCGNTTTGDQEITIIDETAPTLTVPGDVTIECSESTDLSNTGSASASDACDDQVEVTYTDGPVSGSCPYVFVRTFTATDFCGNVSTGEQVISIDDTSAPVLSNGPADASYDCDDNIPTTSATFTDNCDDDINVVMTEETVAQNCGYQLIRLFTASDACGNEAEYTQTITVTDSSDPVLVGIPADVTIECGNAPTAANVTADDNCDNNPTVSMTEVENGQGCDLTIVRTWTATDACGNTASASQTITFEDTTAPVISCPANTTVNCETSNSTPDVTGNATATDNCSGASVTYSDGPLSGNCPAAFVRTWTATDGCGNSTTCEQSITIIDENGPTLVVPDDITISCGESTDESNTGNASAFDACGGASVTYSETTSGDCPIILIRTYTATDACGNTTVGSQTITIVDTTAPVVSDGPADITIQCDGGVPAAEDVVFNDDCSADVIVELSEETTDLNCGFQVNRTWTATDNCGNVGTYTQVISVTDNIAPVFNNIPADATIACGANPPLPLTVTATDNCDDDVTVSFNEETSGSGCSILIVRTWTATDACGNSVSDTQQITITDDEAPVLNGIPGDVEVDCDNIPEPAVVTATDNCDDDVTVSFYEEADFSTCPYTITRHYTAIDACGNLVKDNQVLTVVDNDAPSFGNYPTSITASCDVLESYQLQATDNCDSDVVITYSDNNFSGGCLGVIERTWTATDNCENSVSAIQFITLYDDQAPIVDGVPADITIDCGAEIPMAAQITASDNCDSDLDIEFTEVQNGTDCPYTITRTWTVTDDCDNVTVESQIISVLTGGVVPEAEIVTAPNPFNDNTRISFILPEDGFVLLEVYSSIGELVDVVFKGYALGGMYYEFNIETDAWNSGMYHTKLVFEGEISSTKMLKSK